MQGLRRGTWLGIAFLMVVALAAAACGETKEVVRTVEVEKPVIVEKVVVKEVPVEKVVVVTKEVVKEVLAKGPPKILRISENFVPGDFNPMTGGTPKEFFWAVLSRLVKPDPVNKTYVGDLAERWEIAPNGSSVTFFLRKNALWHDGKPVTAQDVAWTYKMLLSSATGSRQTGKLALIKGAADYTAGKTAEVAGIVVVNDFTIRFDQEFPNLLFVQQASFAEASILPKHILGDTPPDQLRKHRFFADSPVGSGPFKFVKYVDGQFFRMVANPDYYFGPPKIDEIIVNIILSSDAAQIAFQRGELHSMSFDGGTDATTEMFKSAINDPGANVAAEEGSTLISYAFNSRKEHLRDPRIRQAFLYALDRQKLIDTFVGGNGKIFNSFLTHSWYQKPGWEKLYPYNPDKARALLKEAGWDTNREVTATIITVTSEEARALLAAEQSMLAEVGFKLKFKEVALGVWVDTFYETHDFEMIRVTFGVFPDPDGFLFFHLKTGSKNAMGYANPQLDAKIDAGRKSLDQAERARIYQEINEEMLTALPLAPVYLKNFWTIRSNRWYVPGLSDMRPATSLKDMPIFPIYGGAGEIFALEPQNWELR